MTVEKLLKVEIPKRVQYLRVIIMELARITDHLICNAVIGVDTGALTGFVYMFQQRELVYEIYEEICGARLTTNIGRIGGFERDFSPKAWDKIHKFLDEFPRVLKEFEDLLKRNRIFMDRTIGCGGINAERALNYSFTGPNLRAAGVDYDVRVASTLFLLRGFWISRFQWESTVTYTIASWCAKKKCAEHQHHQTSDS